MQKEYLEKLIFDNKNWLNDPRCKCPYNLLKFFKKDIDLKDKLEEFEGEFEKYEVVEV